MYSYCISGDISKDDITITLKQQYPLRNFHVYDIEEYLEDGQHSLSTGTQNRQHSISETFEGTFMTTTPSIVDSLKIELEIRNQEIISLEQVHRQSLHDLLIIKQEHEKLSNDFTILRKKYDEKKQALLDILWNQCSRYHPELSSIPELGESMVKESDDLIDNFTIGTTLGDGKYGVVKSCHNIDDGHDYAVKIISKEKITTVTALHRLSNEIEILKSLQNPCIIALERTLQTKRNLYIVMEKGGPDLFELINKYPNGLPEKWAQNIMSCIVRAVHACHREGICHRDIKPENILLNFDMASGVVTDLKLCDFGLSVDMKNKPVLHDLCGSPGFIAPEMALRDGYNGDKADMWSIGCVLLELMLGHDIFCDQWVNAYNHAILRDKARFLSSINSAIYRFPVLIDQQRYSQRFSNILTQLLRVDPTERPSIFELRLHPCLCDKPVANVNISSNSDVQVSACVTTMKLNLILPTINTLSTENSTITPHSIDAFLTPSPKPYPNMSLSPIKTSPNYDAAGRRYGSISRAPSQANQLFPSISTPPTPEHINSSSRGIFPRHHQDASPSYFDWIPVKIAASTRLNSTSSDASNAPSIISNARMNSEEFPLHNHHHGQNHHPYEYNNRSRASMIRDTISKLSQNM